MTIAQIRELLSPENVEFPAGVAVERVEVEPYVDSVGEDALQVLVVLKDGTDIPMPPGWSPEVKDRIHQTLIDSGCMLHPYTHYALESELQESLEE